MQPSLIGPAFFLHICPLNYLNNQTRHHKVPNKKAPPLSYDNSETSPRVLAFLFFFGPHAEIFFPFPPWPGLGLLPPRGSVALETPVRLLELKKMKATPPFCLPPPWSDARQFQGILRHDGHTNRGERKANNKLLLRMWINSRMESYYDNGVQHNRFHTKLFFPIYRSVNSF